MTQHLLALLGLSALCGGWVLFQGWLAKKDKTYRGYKAGCGACSDSGCDTEAASCTSNKSVSLKLPE